MFLGLANAFSQTPVAKKTPPPLPAATFSNVSYGPHERNVLDLWQAKSKEPAPLLIFIHGGGWHSGDKADLPAKMLAAMLKGGVSVASVNYRYSSIAPLPAPVHDAARAVQFLRTKAAEWHIDPTRFAAYGISAGGCSTLWLAYHDDLADPASADPVARQSTRLQAAVAGSPQTSLEPEIVIGWVGDQVMGHPMIPRAVGAKDWAQVRTHHADWDALLKEFSPINHVSAGDPPVLISFPSLLPLPATSAGAAIHHPIFGMKLKEKADAVGVPCVLRIEDRDATSDVPKPEAFLLEQLKRK
jgi:acetyl esterase/lipase